LSTDQQKIVLIHYLFHTVGVGV